MVISMQSRTPPQGLGQQSMPPQRPPVQASPQIQINPMQAMMQPEVLQNFPPRVGRFWRDLVTKSVW